MFRDGRPCGSYLFVALIGEGSSATCFVVQNANTHEMCVLKVRHGCLLDLSPCKLNRHALFYLEVFRPKGETTPRGYFFRIREQGVAASVQRCESCESHF